jgi:hypothetical protein
MLYRRRRASSPRKSAQRLKYGILRWALSEAMRQVACRGMPRHRGTVVLYTGMTRLAPSCVALHQVSSRRRRRTGDLSPFVIVNVNDDQTTAVAEPLSPLEKLGSALMDQLMRVVDKGIGPITGSRDYAEARLAQFGDREKAIKRIVAETTASSAVAGFVTGLGGLITLPLTLPANITGQAILNARMVGAIAHLRCWDLQDEFVRNSVLITIAGGTPNAVLAEFGVTVAQKSAEAAIKKLPIAIVREINKRVGFMLVAKYGTKRSVVTLTKLVPGFGGVVGGAVDATFSRLVARLARKSFPEPAPTVDETDVGWSSEGSSVALTP